MQRRRDDAAATPRRRRSDDAADAYQDTFLTAANKLDQLRDTERLRSWLYSVARNQCRARLRARKRSTPVDDAGVDVGTEVDMTADLGRDELRVLLTEASAGLNEREREVLDLHMRHELEGEELADARLDAHRPQPPHGRHRTRRSQRPRLPRLRP